MNASTFGLLMTGVLLNAAAQLMLKAGAASVGAISLTAGASALWRTGLQLSLHPGILGGLACYVLSVVVWIVALSRVDVSMAYPMLSIGYVVNALLAWWLFGEAVNAQRWAGIAIIILGVVVIARSGSAA
ncbi:SMR family transporter [Variovorax sp. OV329]|uniref:SMR family transporter n=1 Tax=Variovorax sp. OV329 TaxID=1882825 RepID=UPI0008F096B4|nr:SMR family transporter [Variovorax sp. OV329]SFM18041.1 Multidrug transporter EmrE [Variovorax sp. OV329]